MLVRACRRLSRIAAVPLAFAALTVPAAHAATSCKTAACSGTCTPGAPVGISTIIAAASFPAGMTTPISFVDPADNRARFLVATQQGAILVWDGATGALLPTPFLDLRDDVGGPVLCCGERGLLALATDPDYIANGRLYVYYTRGDGDIVVARYTRSAGNPDLGDVASATVLLVIDHPASNHNGGWLEFGPDGFLYISTGDGGGGCDSNQGANGDGQINTTLLGKVLRIDVRGLDPGGRPPDNCGTGAVYTIPSTNPFFNQTTPCEEVYLLGLRNPFRFGFDRTTGDLYIGDVGQDKWEEINLKRADTAAPVNFGWACREGCTASSISPSFCSTTGCAADTGVSGTCEFPRATGFYDPILCHDNESPSSWSSIMGGYRYRGVYAPSILGSYVYGDAGCGRIWKTTTIDPANPAAIDSACWASGFGGTFGFAQDQRGELYVVVGGAGRVACIHNGLGCFWTGFHGLMEDGFETAGFTRWSGGSSP